MNLTLIVNPELGWDSVVSIFDTDTVTDGQFARLEEICEDNDYILIDWKRLGGVESFIRENE